ncbi:S8/S53 family peptidase [Pyxidicoccus fallax]|uniref:S8/S53 family peptidase n=1 Tax=Pyxidicoccus fallax TaxID=394095 RepID=A0A848LNV7_9BACT|nr:S8/S53 family peptidase [Pyxidicoccus fallax]NMO19224.1 S8/S53 family peptidase [Pyxidicoccus fallax]NPC80857.1 S8/S53 family peptidase [Pyxidicoccus fallax]
MNVRVAWATIIFWSTVVHADVVPAHLSVYQSALEDPTDGAKVDAVAALLPKEGDRFLVEGDLLLDRTGLKEYLARRAFDPRPSAGARMRREVPVDLEVKSSVRQILYRFDETTFSQENLRRARTALVAAQREWKEQCLSCRISWKEILPGDDSPLEPDLVIYFRQTQAPYRVAFSREAGRSMLWVSPAFFTRGGEQSVMRHVWGHVLGYGHVHPLRGLPGCLPGTHGTFEPLSPEQEISVMSPPCGPTLSGVQITAQDAKDFLRSELDWLSIAQKASSPSSPESERGAGLVVVRFEGGKVDEDITRTLLALNESGVLPKEEKQAKQGENLCALLKHQTAVPGSCSPEKLKLTSKLSEKTFLQATLQQATTVVAPNVWFRPYQFTLRFDPESSEDLKRLERLKNEWKTLLKGERETKNGMKSAIFEGYEMNLYVPTDSAAEKAMLSVSSVRSPTMALDFVPTKTPTKPLFALEPGPTFWQRCNQQLNALAGDQGSYIGFMKDPPPTSDTCEANPEQPELLLLDTTIEPHPDLPADLTGQQGTLSPVLLTGNKQSCPVTSNYVEDKHHGSYMASIICSRDNDLGFVGVDPKARVVSVDWAHKSEDEIVRIMQARVENGQPDPVVVFASRFTYQDVNFKEGRLANTEERFATKLAKSIRDLKFPWIVAAGQADPKAMPGVAVRELSPHLPEGPMNMGDLSNVIVVTGCRDCTRQTATILPESNYSGAMVHVAAPGYQIPGAVLSEYALLDGTSPATAFVAGVVSRMMSCHSSYKWRASTVKRRLQFTSRPLVIQQEAAKLAAGIVDPEIALLDPRKNFLKKKNEARTELQSFGWCRSSFRLIHPTLGGTLPDGDIPVEDVYRIVRLKEPGAGEKTRWVVFRKPPENHLGDQTGNVLRIGPGVLPGADMVQPLFSDGSSGVTIEDVEDLLVLPTLKRAPSGSCQ